MEMTCIHLVNKSSTYNKNKVKKEKKRKTKTLNNALH